MKMQWRGPSVQVQRTSGNQSDRCRLGISGPSDSNDLLYERLRFREKMQVWKIAYSTFIPVLSVFILISLSGQGVCPCCVWRGVNNLWELVLPSLCEVQVEDPTLETVPWPQHSHHGRRRRTRASTHTQINQCNKNLKQRKLITTLLLISKT